MAYTPTPIVFTGLDIDTLVSQAEKINDNLDDIQAEFDGLPIGEGVGFDRWALALTGGGTDALDAIDGDELSDGDIAIVTLGTNPTSVSFYALDESSGLPEDSPYVISPDTNAGMKRWILGGRVPRLWKGAAIPGVDDDASYGVLKGDHWIYDGYVWICSVNTTGAAKWGQMIGDIIDCGQVGEEVGEPPPSPPVADISGGNFVD